MPARSRLLAPAKLTRSLRIVGRRDDGYHLLDAEMVSLDLADELEVEEVGGPAGCDGEVELEDDTGARVPAARAGEVPVGDRNLVCRALALVGRRAKVRIRKRIPAGAGLGGGSSDAAAILRWAGVADPVVALSLGADVPFCLAGGRARVRGVGEQVDALAGVALGVVLVTPALRVSTADVYAAYDRLSHRASSPRVQQREGRNDLEPAAVALVPQLARWRDALAEATGLVASLAGSGSTWFVECEPSAGEDLAREVAREMARRGLDATVRAARTIAPLEGAGADARPC
jgi:4-diphosphocytidyl-2-C-methyl-D-erythritol kinase